MPVERWSPAQVTALAPDASSLKGARGVSAASRWAESGLAGEVLWGLCRGSGKSPYQVCVNLSGPAYKCSCPSRKFPCKHALGLLMLWSESGVGDAGAPAFVTEWQASRVARTAAPKVARPPDPAAAQKRLRQREERVAGGMAELSRWLDDQVQQGLATAERAGWRPFEAMAARLVDAQAPAAASSVRRLGAVVGIGPQWADRLLGELGLLRLLVAGHDHLDELPAGLAATVRMRIGYPVSAEEVLAGPRVRDRWQVLGQVDSDDGNLMSRRIWLRGADSGRFALLLSFAAPGQTLQADVVPGVEMDAELCFYPGAYPIRAVIADRRGTPVPLVAPAGATTLDEALAAWSAALAAEPWRHDIPVLLAGVTPSATGWLTDGSGRSLPLAAGHREPWWLLAAAGGRPATVAAEWSAAGLRPLAAWADGTYVPAAPPLPGGPAATRTPELPPDLLAAALVGTARRPWTSPSVTVGARHLITAATSTDPSLVTTATSTDQSLTTTSTDPIHISAVEAAAPARTPADTTGNGPGRAPNGREPGAGMSGLAGSPAAGTSGHPGSPDASTGGHSVSPDAGMSRHAGNPDASTSGHPGRPDASTSGRPANPDASMSGPAEDSGADMSGHTGNPDASTSGHPGSPDTSTGGHPANPDAGMSRHAGNPDASTSGHPGSPDASTGGHTRNADAGVSGHVGSSDTGTSGHAGSPDADTNRHPGSQDAGVSGPTAGRSGSRIAGAATALLEAAGAAVVYRRAGVVPAEGQVPVAAAPEEASRALPVAAGARLRRILTDGGVPGGSQVAQELLAQWLRLAAAYGGHVPPETLPALLDAGRRNGAIRAPLAQVAGRRGAWLAAMRTDWRWLLDEAPATTLADWETGSAGERLAYLTHLRGSDPAAGRALLERTWAAESSDDRARFLTALQTGLSTADDAFLDQALDDRRKEVREAALELLRQLPGAGLGERMTERVLQAVSVERRTFGRDRLVVRPPEDLDLALRRDGVGATPARGIGVGAWLLEEIVAGAPLHIWTPRFGRNPEAVLDLARGHDWESPLLHGWAKAAIAQRDARWAEALVANDARNNTSGLREAVRWDLHLILPPAELARIAADFLRREDHLANRLLAVHQGDWPDELAVAVIETIARRARTDRHTWQLSELSRAAALAMPPRYAPHLAQLAAQLDQEPAEESRVRPVAELARTLTFRHEMHQEFE